MKFRLPSPTEKARKVLESNPTPENKVLHNKAAAIVKKTIQNSKRDKWRNTCQDLDLNRDGTKAWSLLHNLCGDKKKNNPRPMNTTAPISPMTNEKLRPLTNTLLASTKLVDSRRRTQRLSKT